MADEKITAIVDIEDGAIAKAKTLRQNFRYLEDKVTAYSTTISNKESLSSKGNANGYCPLDSTTKIPYKYFPDALFTTISEASPIGIICMWGTADIPNGFIPMIGQTDLSNYPKLQELGYSALPDTRDRVPQGSSTAFKLIEAGLPNITGKIGKIDSWSLLAEGAFTLGDGHTDHSRGTENYKKYYYNFDASLSNRIYGNNETVQPPAWTTVFIIKYQ